MQIHIHILYLTGFSYQPKGLVNDPILQMSNQGPKRFNYVTCSKSNRCKLEQWNFNSKAVSISQGLLVKVSNNSFFLPSEVIHPVSGSNKGHFARHWSRAVRRILVIRVMNAGSFFSQSCDLGRISSPLWASVSASVKWRKQQSYLPHRIIVRFQ